MSSDNEQINSLVAEKVMGYVWVRHDSGRHRYRTGAGEIAECEWNPAENIQDAWEIVNKLRGDWDFHLTGESAMVPSPRWQASVTPVHAGEDTYGPYADTPAMAICLAALLAYGVELPTQRRATR